MGQITRFSCVLRSNAPEDNSRVVAVFTGVSVATMPGLRLRRRAG